MAWIFPLLCAALLLLRPGIALDAAGEACRLFALSVLPGLYPYMILLLLALAHLPPQAPFGALVALGWGAGSPCGAKICRARQDLWPPRRLRRLAVCCGTMSPMFLYGTLGRWLHNETAGLCVLLAVWGGGWLAAQTIRPDPAPPRLAAPPPAPPLTLGMAVEQASIALLTVCGCMVLGNVYSALIPALLPGLPQSVRLGISCLLEVTCASQSIALLTVCGCMVLGNVYSALIPALLPGLPQSVRLGISCLLEVTCASQRLVQLPLPLPLRVGLLSGETGFGALALLLQNRALGPHGLWPLRQQLGFQLLHGLLSALTGYGLALLLL